MSKNKKNIRSNAEGLIPKLRFPEFENEGEWKRKMLIETADKKVKWSFTGGPFGSNLQASDYTSEGIRIIQLQNIGDGEFNDTYKIYTSKEKADELLSCNIYSGEIILSKMGDPVGRACIIPKFLERCVMASDGIRLVIDEEKYSKFFIYSLLNSKSIRGAIEKKATGSTRKRIGLNELREIELIVPRSLSEQQKIASCLSSLDEVIAAHSQKFELLKDHKKGLMQNLFPQGGKKVPKYRFKEFEKDEEWVEKTLRNVAENVMYGMNSAAVEYDGQNKYIRITDIDENSRLFLPNPLTSPDGQLEEKYTVNVGDLLFARTGASVGKSYLHQNENGKIYFAGFLIRFTIKDAIPYFIYAQTLTEQYQKWILKTSMRSGQPGINAEEYKSYPIFLPPTITEQQKIASCLSALDDLIAVQAKKIEQLKLHKKGLMQGLFPKTD